MLTPKITFERQIIDNLPSILCRLVWEGEPLDRPSTSGISVLHPEVAIAYQKAVADGKMYKNPKVGKDHDGKTYVEDYDGFTTGKYLKARLEKLGYL